MKKEWPMDYCIVLTTTNSQEEADTIASLLLENRAAACVQFSPISSLYHWEGKIERSDEIRLLIKTTGALYPRVESLIKENHSYQVPQIVKLPVNAGLPEYLDWITEETT
jgi:periplasmic divalent cation tolerance protein